LIRKGKKEKEKGDGKIPSPFSGVKWSEVNLRVC
jgi:hypothetical protein